jgi:kynurenine formamidase
VAIAPAEEIDTLPIPLAAAAYRNFPAGGIAPPLRGNPGWGRNMAKIWRPHHSRVAQFGRIGHVRRQRSITTATQNVKGEKGAMRIIGLAAFAGISVLSLMLATVPASAQADCKALVPPSPFGPDDQTGATNRVTPAVTKAAAAEIQTGNVISMSNVLVDGVPLFGTRFSKTVLTAIALAPGGEFGKNKMTYMEDTWLSQSHVGTHIDGVGHIGIEGCYYNQTPMAKFISQNYMKKLGIENIKTFATRGVLVDMVKQFQAAGKLKSNPACRTPCLDMGTVITPDDLQAALKAENVTLREADAVFLHTGWEDLFLQWPAQNATYNKGEPGIGQAAAEWLAAQKVVAIGADTWAVEVIPLENKDIAFPVHVTTITNNGIHLIENVRTDLIAAEAAKTGRYTFFLYMTVPKAVGLTGNFVNVQAIQ